MNDWCLFKNINRLTQKSVKIHSYVQLIAQSVKSCRYVHSQLSPHSVCCRCSAREANRQSNWRRHQSTACRTQKGSASAHVVLYHFCLFSLQTRCLSEPGARLVIGKSERGFSYLTPLPRTAIVISGFGHEA